jgi:hypothetical protein
MHPIRVKQVKEIIVVTDDVNASRRLYRETLGLANRWLSNLHCVVNPSAAHGPSGTRLSIAFFNHPNDDVLIECIAPPDRAAHPPVLSGDYRDLKYTKTGLAAATIGARGEVPLH